MALFDSQYFPSIENYNPLYELAPFSFGSSDTLGNSVNFFPDHVVTFKAKSTTELVAIRARVQPNDPAIYTGSPEDGSAIALRSLA